MEVIKFADFPEIMNKNLKIKDIKRIIKDKTGIKEENQRFQVNIESDLFNFHLDEERQFWNNFEIQIYDTSRYKAKLKTYIYETDIFLDLKKNNEDLKQMIYEQTKIPKERQKIYLNNEEITYIIIWKIIIFLEII